MTGRLEGKRAVITAAAQGIGRASAELFVREGATVIATDVNEAALAGLEGCTTRRLDVTDPAAIASFAAEIGAVDVLFNCAGYVHHGTILDCGEAGLGLLDGSQRRIDVPADARVAAGNAGARRRRIVNMSSVASSVKGVPNRFVYGTSKAAVIGLTKAVAMDFVGQGIRCNAICPGTVETPSLDGRMRAQGDYEAARKAFVARQPMGRLGTPLEIAQLALYLASDESGYTTGAIHVIDGGMTC